MPLLLIERSLKVATPFTAFTGVVPLSVPPPGFVPMATVIEAVLEVTTFPPASSTLTATAGVIEDPAAVFVGWTVKASFVAVPTETLMAVLVAAVSAPLVALSV